MLHEISTINQFYSNDKEVIKMIKEKTKLWDFGTLYYSDKFLTSKEVAEMWDYYEFTVVSEKKPTITTGDWLFWTSEEFVDFNIYEDDRVQIVWEYTHIV